MQPSINTQTQQGFFTRQKNKISQLTEGWMLELSILATILFCVSFWYDLPDLNINPILGKGISAIGILVLFSIIAFKLKWPIIIGVAGLVIYTGVNFMQTGTLKDVASQKHEQNDSKFVKNNNTDVLYQHDQK